MASLIPGVTAPENDSTAQYLDEWDLAQQRYRAGVNAGYKDEDAAKMYLEPVKNKWDLLKSVPLERREQAAQDLDNAHMSFLKGIQAGYKDKDSENLFLKPVEQKWQTAASIPQPAKADPYRQYKAGAISAALYGAKPDVIQDIMSRNEHNIFADEKFSTDFFKAWEAGQKANQNQALQASKIDAQQQMKNLASKSPKALISELGAIENDLKNYANDINVPAAKVLRQRKQAIVDYFNENPDTLSEIGNTAKFSFDTNEDRYSLKMPLDKTSKMLDVSQYETPEDVGQAFKNNEITMQQAKQILSVKFGNRFKK